MHTTMCCIHGFLCKLAAIQNAQACSNITGTSMHAGRQALVCISGSLQGCCSSNKIMPIWLLIHWVSWHLVPHAPLMHVAWLHKAIQLQQHIRAAAAVAVLMHIAAEQHNKQQCI
jgi:hypothetical protein